MKFGPVPIDDAQGTILAHSLTVGGTRLKKGRVLSASDVDHLREHGTTDVIVAAPSPDDVTEDAAATRLIHALVPDPAVQRVTIGAAFTGRANVYAAVPGVFSVDEAAVSRLNEIDEAITLATLPNHSRVAARQMLGTVKIIPYACESTALDRAVAAIGSDHAMAVNPVSARSVHLILTRTPGMKPTLLTRGADAVRDRVRALGLPAPHETVVDHQTEALADALRSTDEELVLILTGSATSDRKDVGPAALVAAGGRLERFGMPVDPGNLLFLGAIQGRSVIGLPGCARSPKLNGADWVLERVASGLSVTKKDIAGMGVGGLLKEIPSRPQPRDGGAGAPRRPEIAAILLAAGNSSRMRGKDKLMEPVAGVPLLRRVADQIAASSIDRLVCVGRAEEDERRDALEGTSAQWIVNLDHMDGMATSIAAGIAALPRSVDAAIVIMGDMPDVRAKDLDRLAAAFDPGEDRAVVRAVTEDGTPGHPVLFGRRFFEDLMALEGDVGARQVIAENPDFVTDVVLPGQSATTDLDTPEAWDEWRNRK